MLRRHWGYLGRDEGRRSKRHEQPHAVRVQQITNAIHALPIHDAACLEIRVVERLEARFAAQEQLCDAAGPGDEDGSKHVVDEGVAGSFNVRHLGERGGEVCKGKYAWLGVT